MSRRLSAYIILSLAILFLPFWVYLPLLLLSSIVFRFFWEGIVFAFLIEVLYGVGVRAVMLSPIALSILALVVVLIPLRKRLRWNLQNF